MCDVKPNPRCFTHYEPRYNDAKDAYQEALDDFESKEKAGTLTDEDYDNLAAAFEEYQACQRMYYMSPKARRHRHADEVAKVREALEEAKNSTKKTPTANTPDSSTKTPKPTSTKSRSRTKKALAAGRTQNVPEGWHTS